MTVTTHAIPAEANGRVVGKVGGVGVKQEREAERLVPKMAARG
jgi:hypothetical protein